jgi:hypothetical protein
MLKHSNSAVDYKLQALNEKCNILVNDALMVHSNNVSWMLWWIEQRNRSLIRRQHYKPWH